MNGQWRQFAIVPGGPVQAEQTHPNCCESEVGVFRVWRCMEMVTVSCAVSSFSPFVASTILKYRAHFLVCRRKTSDRANLEPQALHLFNLLLSSAQDVHQRCAGV